MILTLEVTSPQRTKLGGASCQTFQEDGGSIGRETDNSWVLPHSKVSGHHAVITYCNAVYYIEDRSRNGVCLNSPKNRLERERPYALTSGDRILIDPYEILVSITRDRNDQAEASNPFDADDPFAPQPIPSSGLDSPAEEIAGQQLDPLELLDLIPKRGPARKAPSARDLDLGSQLDGHYQPPAVMPAPESESPAKAIAIPSDYDPLAPDVATPVPWPSSPEPPSDERAAAPPLEERVAPARRAPARISPPAESSPSVRESTPSPRESSPSVRESSPSPRESAPVASIESPGGVDFAAVLAGAGLDPANVTPEIARDFGQILRVVVSGVMDVMRSRQQIKDEFRMRMTRFRAAENNPLKFSANVDDALHNLLVKRNPAYLAPVEAFEEAFADLRHHQVAMLAGIRVAFESMLAEFDPDHLQQEFDRQLNKGLVPAKLRYWDLFREKGREIVKDPEASFRRLFGDEFGRAYEDQLKQLKAQESSAGKASSKAPK